MSFFSSIKRALGFGGDDEEDELLDSEAVAAENDEVTDSDNRIAATDTPESTPQADTASAKPAEKVDATLAADLFDGVIAVFNEALPGFVERCIDKDGQRQVLLESLENSLRSRLSSAVEEARSKGLREIESDRSRLNSELKELRDKNRRLDERRNETNAARLSAERQKRALQERVHDLESQVTALEAEKEQYELETKSMMSRMRAAGVSMTGEAEITDNSEEMAKALADKDTEIASLRERIEKAAAELKTALEEKTKAAEERDKTDKERADAETRASELTEKCALMEQQVAETEPMRKENADLHDAMEQLKAKQQMTDALINSLQSKASEARGELNEARLALSQAENEKSELQARLGRAEAELAEATRRNDELQKNANDGETMDRAAIESIEKQLSGFEKVKERLDRRIAELKEENARLKLQNEYLEASGATVTDAPAKYSSGKTETEDSPEAEKADAPKRRGRKKKQPKISAIDEFMENSDWFGAPTPEEEKAKAEAERSSAPDDFGYKQPQRKIMPDNEDQLSLW